MQPATRNKTAALVVGGGIAGIQASLDLVNMGYHVYLVEKNPAIGGTMPMLGKTFPTNDCSICILSPKLVELGRHQAVTLFTGAEIIDLSGTAGDFKASVRVLPRGVDVDKCTSCDACAAECPVMVDNEFNQLLDGRKAIYKLYPQAYPNAYALDRANCIDCAGCATVCPNGAINYQEKEKIYTLQVGAVILCPGSSLIDPRVDGEYRYKRLFPGALTSLEFERLLSASGPLAGRNLLHLATGREIHKVAWIQCTGSREPARGLGHCSAVCCMYAIKQALVARELAGGPFSATVFYTDMRVYGKGFEKYYRQAVAGGVRFIRARVAEIKGTGERNGPLLLKYIAADGSQQEEDFDLVVLSTGLAARETGGLAKPVGITLNSAGFCDIVPFTGVETTRAGVFAAGGFTGPKDIPDTVTQASAAAAAAAAVLGPAFRREGREVRERDVAGEEPRTGVAVCCCGGNIDRVVNVDEVVRSLSGLPGVAWSGKFTYACSQNSLAKLRDLIREEKLNRLVVAACSPRTHRFLFQNIMQEAGVNRYLAEMANIRDQCSWVHRQDSTAATRKALDLAAMAVARAASLKPLREMKVNVTPTALVVGGGPAGMSCALSLAGCGFQVDLVEKEMQLGGLARKMSYGPDGKRIDPFLNHMVDRVLAHPLITVHTGREVRSVSGYVGNYTTVLSGGERIEHGCAVIATGGREGKPDAFLYGRHPGVKTLLELEQEMAAGREEVQKAKNIVFIQCAGSRDEKHPYCSRVCCTATIRLALALQNGNPNRKITVLYRDMVTYGLGEEHYLKAREKGILFVRYRDDDTPFVAEAGELLQVRVVDDTLGRPVILPADLVALAAPVIPAAGNPRLAGVFKVPLNEDGFFLEAHMKLAPADTAAAGVFLCGLAHAPKSMEESIIQGRAAASRAASILSRQELTSNAMVARVQAEKCAGCLTCVRLCPYSAPRMVNNRAQIEPLACQGCGVCAGECPNQAINLEGYRQEGFGGMLKSLLGGANGGTINR